MRQTFLLPLLIGGIAPSAFSQIPSAMLREGEPLVGAPAGHVISAISESVVNQSGGYAATVNTLLGTTTLTHVWGHAGGGAGGILRSEQSGISGFDQTGMETFFGMGNLGEIAYSPTCNVSGGGATGLDTVWLDNTPVAVQGDPILTVPGMVFRFASRPGITGNGMIYWVSGINSAGGTNMGEGLFTGVGQTPILKTGDPAPAPLTSTIGDVDFDVRFSANGTHWIMNVDTTEPTTSDECMLIDGAIVVLAGGGLAREGTLVPAAAGGNGTEAWGTAFDALSINEAGDYCFSGDTTAATTADGVVVKNGVILHREGDVLDGLTLTGTPGELWMNEQGDVALVWTTTGALDALFVNGQKVIMEGDAVDWDNDGIVDPGSIVADITGSVSHLIGPRGPTGNITVYFTADIDNDGAGTAPLREGYFRMVLGSDFTPYCFGDGTGAACPCANNSPIGAGEGCLHSLGLGAKLVATGTASLAADTVVLHGSQMPDASALYFQGVIQLGGGNGLPFGDGLRCVGGQIHRLDISTNVGGMSQYPAIGQPAISLKGNVLVPGTRQYQVWYRNAATFCTAATFNVSNGLSIVWGL